MRITIFGAAGDVGSRVVTEALSRGHEVTAVVRNHAQIDTLPAGATGALGDVANTDDVVRLTTGQDVAISAIRPVTGKEALLATLTKSILDGVAQTSTRVIIVGGAASLKLPNQNETTVLTAPDFLPESVVPIARACFAQHDACRADANADWVYLSPPAMLTPGTRTGKFRIGADTLLVDQEGNSAISMEDFAIALLDEAEQPKHLRTRFTVAY